MSFGQRLDKFNRSRLSALLICVGVLLIMLFCNFRTNLIADDYRYFFSFSDDSRIENVMDIVSSMAAHRLSMNGRIFAHALVQLFLLLPLWVFKLINSAFFLGLILLMYKLSLGNEQEGCAILLGSLFCGVWLLQGDFGQVFLWLDGAINYLWCAVFSLLFILPYVKKFLFGKELNVGKSLGFAVFSFFFGGYSENSSVAIIFMALLLLLLCRFWKKESLKAWTYISLAATLLGFFFMISAPAEFANKSAGSSFAVLFENFMEACRVYLHFWPALLCFALFFYCAIKAKLPLQLRLLSLVFLAGSLAGHFVLTFASYIAWRSTYISLVLLLVACGILYAPLFSGRKKLWLSGISAVALCFSLYWGALGVADINATYYNLSYNEALISECAANGVQSVALPRFYSQTRYSALAGLAYLDTEDSSYWANVYMAKYYGVDSVLGY